MKQIESSLNWNGAQAGRPALTVAVGNVTTPTAITAGVVCLSEQSKSGTVFAIVDVAAGTNAGTYFGKKAPSGCSDTIPATDAMTSSW